jgi:hypothetical protein
MSEPPSAINSPDSTDFRVWIVYHEELLKERAHVAPAHLITEAGYLDTGTTERTLGRGCRRCHLAVPELWRRNVQQL